MKRKYEEIEKDNIRLSKLPEERDDSSANNNENLNSKKPIMKGDREEIKTFIRIRQIENDPGIFKTSENDYRNLLIEEDGKPIKTYNFTQVFGSSTSQMALYENICAPLINDLIENKKSGLIFAYGITNSGKTFTITGKPDDPGILPMSLSSIKSSLENRFPQPELYVNYIEIYNEDVIDLLSQEPKEKAQKKKLKVKEKQKNIFYVDNVTERKIFKMTDLSDCLNQGVIRKTHASTNLNPESSRSHTIFKIILRYPSLLDSEFDETSLSIVDLAGCEKVSRADTTGKEFKESCNINQSLTTLSLCLSNMRHNTKMNNEKKKNIPHRESQLTKLLFEYFQRGDSIAMIANINPSKEDLYETINVINYASLSREIKPSRLKVFINPLVSNKKGTKKIQDKGFVGNEKYDNSDFYSDEENLFPNSGFNNSMIFNQVGSRQNLHVNQINTISSNPEIEAMNEKINELYRQHQEMQSNMQKVLCENEKKHFNSINYLVKNFTDQLNNKDNMTFRMMKVVENLMINKQNEPSTNIIMNPYLQSSSKKKLVKFEDLGKDESNRVDNEVLSGRKSSKKKSNKEKNKKQESASKISKTPQISQFNFMIQNNNNLNILPKSPKKLNSDQKIENENSFHISISEEKKVPQSSNIYIYKSSYLPYKDEVMNKISEIDQNPFLETTNQDNNNLIHKSDVKRKHSLSEQKSNQLEEDIPIVKSTEQTKINCIFTVNSDKKSKVNTSISEQNEIEKSQLSETEVIQQEQPQRKYKKTKKKIPEKTTSTNVSYKDDQTDQSDFSDQNSSDISFVDINKANEKKTRKKTKKKKNKKEDSEANLFEEDEVKLIVKTIDEEENEEEEVKNQEEEEKSRTLDPEQESEPKGKGKKGKTKSKKNNNTKKTKKK